MFIGTSENEQDLPRTVPDWPFRPVKPLGDSFDPRVFGHQRVEPRIETLDRAQRGKSLLLREGVTGKTEPRAGRRHRDRRARDFPGLICDARS